MDDSSRQATSPTWAVWPWDKLPNPFSSLFAPQALNQPINPGWGVGNTIVTEQNSSAPDTEQEIVAEDSYGRQLGRIIDALSVLIAERPKSSHDVKALDDLVELHTKIEKIKTRTAARRLERIGSDLALLKKKDAGQYDRVVTALRKALGDTRDRRPK